MNALRSQISFALRFLKIRMVYRAAFWIDFLFDTLVVFMQVFVWRSLLGAGTETVVTIPEMTTYVALSSVIRGLTRTRADMIIEDRLESGNICFDLVRPITFRRQMALTDLGRCLNEFLVHAIPSFLVVALVFGVVPPASVTALLMFIGLATGGVIVSYYLSYIVGLLGFFFLKASHLSWVFGTIQSFLSGAMIPLWFYPDWLARIAAVTPFKLIFFTPISVYLGKTVPSEIGPELLLFGIWLVALVAIESLLWNRAVRRLVVQGG